MIQPKDELIRDCKTKGIKKQVQECINAAFSKGYETCFEQKEEIEDRAYKTGYDYGYEVGKKDYEQNNKQFDLGYQQGLEDGRKQGVAIDGDKRYWKGYHAAQDDGRKIYQKGIDEGWAMIRKMYHDYKGNFGEKLKDVFGYRAFIDVIDNLSPSEAVEKIREYEEKQKQEGRSGYVSFAGEKPQEQGVTTVYPDSPCDLCRFKGLGDGKPCTMCPAEEKVEE